MVYVNDIHRIKVMDICGYMLFCNEFCLQLSMVPESLNQHNNHKQ